MTALEQMAGVLVAMNPPPKDRKQQAREWNRRYYERNRERYGWMHHAVARLNQLGRLLREDPRRQP